MDISKRLFQMPCDPYKDQIVNDLLREVWGFSSPHAVPKAKAASCFNHYESLLSNRQILDDQNTNLRESESQSSDVRALIGRLKKQVHHPITDIRKSIADDSPSWLLNTQNLDTLDKVLQFCVRLWLFVKPDLADENATLQVAVRNSVSKFGAPSNSWLWMDFSAKTLMERGRFHITWTSDIAEHLTFASKSVIRVFSHASVIELYEASAEGNIYPLGLLRELRKTLNLLWPIEDVQTARHVFNLEEKQEVDVEAGMGYLDKFDLQTYPIFGERLAKIQERLESEENRRANSFGFRIAIWGILLTAIFGLISAVTGILQVWTSLR